VRFRDLFERLPRERAASGAAALHQVLALARQIRMATKPRSELARLGLAGWIVAAESMTCWLLPEEPYFLRAVGDFQSFLDSIQ